MKMLPEALKPLAEYKQFVNWIEIHEGDKIVKLPTDPRTGSVCDAHNQSVWVSAEEALSKSERIAFVFTDIDPFYFVDIDSCLQDGPSWSPLALDCMAMLPGAAIEVSISGKGLHIIGSGSCPAHKCKSDPKGVDLYTSGRFVALTGTNVIGSAGADNSETLPAFVEKYFTHGTTGTPQEWTTAPVAGYSELTDEEIISKASATQSARSVFGGSCSFAQLWTADVDAMAVSYPDDHGVRSYDGSAADMALAQHLAFWTGNNCERILLLMWQSGLVRDKWQRDDYLYRTIINAVSMQTVVYSAGAEVEPFPGMKPIKSNSEKQRLYAEKTRTDKLALATPEQIEAVSNVTSAKLWLDKSLEEIISATTPVSASAASMITEPQLVSGYQYLSATMQMEYFRGCIYVQDLHRILVPSGALLTPDRFNATYGGYVMQIDETGDKTTRKAWEAFTESQVVRFPKVIGLCFKPMEDPGIITTVDGQTVVNAYVPVNTERRRGDPAPFLLHLAKMLPDELDQKILLSYMAACVQYKGIKFNWCPLLQGTEGNGKTLFTRCVAFAIGKRYTHYPKAMDIDNKFNGWLLNKLFIGVEDIFVPDHRREVIETLKPMITGDGLEIQMKGVDQITADVCANFLLNSNHKDAIRKTKNDRRFAVFYTAQQTVDDLKKYGMTGNYFPNLYKWLRAGGYAIVNEFLSTYDIQDELNPATECHRAPITTSNTEVISASMGSIEQEIAEAIEEGRVGFCGGWVSSVAVDRLLNGLRAGRAIPPARRTEILRTIGYEPHPALVNGRVNNIIMIDDGKKPRLFINSNNPARGLSSPAEVSRAYQIAQGVAV